MKSWMALALSALVILSNPFSPAHLLQESDQQTPRPVLSLSSDDHRGQGDGLVPDHSLDEEPLHVCVLCKNVNGMLDMVIVIEECHFLQVKRLSEKRGDFYEILQVLHRFKNQ